MHKAAIITLILGLVIMVVLIAWWATMRKSGMGSGKTAYKVSLNINSDLKTLTEAQYNALPVDSLQTKPLMVISAESTQIRVAELIKDRKISVVVGMFGFPKNIVFNTENGFKDTVLVLGNKDTARIVLELDNSTASSLVATLRCEGTAKGITEFTLAQLQKMPGIIIHYNSANAVSQILKLTYATVANNDVTEATIGSYTNYTESSEDPAIVNVELKHNQ